MFQALKCFKPTFVEADQASEMICKERLLKSRIKTSSFLEEITASSIEVFNYFESEMAVGIRKLGNTTQETAESNVIPKQTAGSPILILDLQAKKSNL